MPTNTNAYNSRVTDEALEKRFRDTFRAQGGAELVDDLYAQGVIVPVVDFTAAATGQTLGTDLQTAWDFATQNTQVVNSSANIITNAGFWYVDLIVIDDSASGGSRADVKISDGLSSRTIYQYQTGSTANYIAIEQKFVIYVRSGDTVSIESTDINFFMTATYRQIATASGDLIDPSGFTSS